MLERILFLSSFHPFPEGDVGSFLVRLSRPRSDQDGETKYSLAVKYVLQSHSALSSSFREVTFPPRGQHETKTASVVLSRNATYMLELAHT